jgi:hypothetical protein
MASLYPEIRTNQRRNLHLRITAFGWLILLPNMGKPLARYFWSDAQSTLLDTFAFFSHPSFVRLLEGNETSGLTIALGKICPPHAQSIHYAA